ncbi:transcriptional repressor LexA [bacterium]|nr:transcriptional repressor LexA [bacterium]
MKGSLTERQSRILEYIRLEIAQRGFPPTYREIGRQFGIKSTNGVNATLKALEKKGYLIRHSKLSRGIEIVDEFSPTMRKIPFVGRVAAGEPVLAEQNIEGEIGIDNSFFSGESIFALTVQGDSMKDAGIFDGDKVFVRLQQTADTGDIVVALIGDEATVKHYYPERERIRLEPANENYGPIIVEPDTPGFRIAGKVVGLIRKI